jgi:putative phage-type endonuclease
MALTKKQEELRRFAVGASEIAVLAGLSRWRTPIALWEAKLAGHRDDAGVPAELGTLLEESLAKLYAKRTGTEKRLVKCASLVHPEKSFALATPDRVVFPVPRVSRALVHDVAELRDAERNVQIKSTSWRLAHEWGEPGTDAVPEEYLVQVQWEMGVTGLRLTDVAVLFDKDRFDVYPVPFNEQLWLGLLEIAEQFVVDYLLTGKPPPPDASTKYAEYLTRAYGTADKSKKVAVDGGSELAVAVGRYALLSTAQKRLKAHKELLSNKIKAAIGEGYSLTGDFGEVKWLRKPPSSTTDFQKAFLELKSAVLLAVQSLPEGDQRGALEAVLQGLEQRHRKAARRYDQLRPDWAAGVVQDVEELELKLARIEAGDTTTTEED